MAIYTVTAQATITLTGRVEANNEAEALARANELSVPYLCHGCETQNGDPAVWCPDLDGEPVNVEVVEG